MNNINEIKISGEITRINTASSNTYISLKVPKSEISNQIFNCVKFQNTNLDFTEGDKVLITGSLNSYKDQRQYQHNNKNINIYKTNILINKIEKL